VLCVGESAHALPPHLGQSAAQAFEDATVLRDLLSQGLAPAVLAQRFSERRVPRASQVFDLVCQAARSQLSPDAGTDLRDLAQQLSRIVATAA
jgi:2-polyprenyl-6-methoxyphenol hydroxylase-like FAD-dependent oxidoreductase